MQAYDSDNISDIPTNAEVIAYYNDGEPGTATPEQLASFPNAKKYSITRRPGVKAYWMDVENGAATIQQFLDSYQAGEVSGIYISASQLPFLEQAAHNQDIKGYDLWAADWTGQPHVYPGSVWTQYISPSTGSPGHYDISEIWSGWVPKGESVSDTGTPTERKLAAPIVAGFPTVTGNGYYLIGADGGVFTFGDAQLYPTSDGQDTLSKDKLTRPIVSGWAVAGGYFLVGADGGVFAFGSARFHGSLPADGFQPAD